MKRTLLLPIFLALALLLILRARATSEEPWPPD